MTKPLISVLMPVRNGEKYLRQAIQSVLDQSFGDFELLIINDCSKDHSVLIAESFRDPRVKLIHTPQRLEVAETLNFGLRQAHGRYIARLDADDIALPQRFKKQLKIIQENPQAVLVTSWTEVINAEDAIINRGNWRFTPEAFYFLYHFRGCLTHSSVLFPKKTALAAGGYPQIRTEDFALWRKLTQRGPIIQVPEFLVQWRNHQEGISARKKKLMETTACQLCQRHVQEATGIKVSPAVARILADPAYLRQAHPAAVKEFTQAYPRILKKILQNAPAFYNQRRLQNYAHVELYKYYLILKDLGYPTRRPRRLQEPITVKEKLLAYAYFISRFKNYRYVNKLIEKIIPKSHF